MGGSGGGSAGPKPDVQYAEPIDYAQLFSMASEASMKANRDQIAATIEAYPQMEALQLGTANKIRNNLAKTWYTRQANQALGNASIRQRQVGEVGGELRGLGQTMAAEGLGQLAQSGPTSIESELYRQAESDLALGRSLSPEEQRDAQQSARAAFSARGMGTSMGSTAAEILNRDGAAQAREAARRNFAASANNMQTQNVLARRAGATNEIGLGGNFLSSGANTLSNASQLGIGLASGFNSADPYARALGMATPYATNTLNNATGMVQNNYNNALSTAGNVMTFNANMLDTRANSAMNNWAAMRGASMQASALGQQGMMGMFGGIGGGVATGAGLAIAGASF